VSPVIRWCHERAAEAKAKADETDDPALKAECLASERRWLFLARSYGFAESLEDFTAANSDQRWKFEEHLQQPSASVGHVRKNLDGPDDILQLHEISTLLIQEGKLDSLYNRILEAISIMSSDMASMQLLDPDRKQLQLLVWKGFHPQSAAFWQSVHFNSVSSCGLALATGSRVVIGPPQSAAYFISTRRPFLACWRLATLETVDRHTRRPCHDGRSDQDDQRLDCRFCGLCHGPRTRWCGRGMR
jgi:hypothetical protein